MMTSMRERSAGFTLIELMIVVAIIAIIASIAIPNMIAARLNANESAAIATLRTLLSSQAQFQASAHIDANSNGAGEFGFFAELSGRAPLRSDEVGGANGIPLQPPVLSTAFGNVVNSRVVRSGYCFQMYLPDATGAGVPEAADGGSAGVSVDAGLASVMWCCYAWPTGAGTTGRRVFFTNHRGDVLSSDNRTPVYNGAASAPLPSAAFLAGSSGTMDCATAANTVGGDGDRWRVVN